MRILSCGEPVTVGASLQDGLDGQLPRGNGGPHARSRVARVTRLPGRISMALGFYFRPQSFTKEQYDETLRRLEQAGAGSPPGRSFHFAFTGQDGGIAVFDVWESQESFDRFGETLV